MNIPEQIKEFNFVLLNEKKPFEKGWQKKIHRINDPIFQEHIKSSKNYGVQMNESSLNGNFLIVIDFDNKDFQEKIINRFPETFTTTSGSPKNCFHLWFLSDNNKAFKVKDSKLNTYCDVLGAGNQVVAPGSKHSSGSIYSVVKDLPLTFISYSEIEAILKPLDESPKAISKPKKDYSPKGISQDVSEEIINAVSMGEILTEVGVDTSRNPTNCFGHSSNGGKCFSFNEDVAHCFHCDKSWNKFSLVREVKNLTDKETFEWFAVKSGNEDKLKKSRKEFVKENPFKIFSKQEQVKELYKVTPLFYDRAGIFWMWNTGLFKWEKTDEIDLLNMLKEALNEDIINSKNRQELINLLKQTGRKSIPKPIKSWWVQYKDKIYDIKTGDIFQASPEFFVKNPIPWRVGLTEETPTIDKLFNEWVGADYVKTLYQILAYTTCPDRFMQRIIAFVGGGSNGKGTCVKLVYKFLGEDNSISSELKLISENQFETAIIYGKLLCVFGEVSYDDLKNTNTLKQIAGEDKLRYCFKGKTPFTDVNTAMGLCLTNSLPITRDRTLGFYRKWLVIDFPNQFNGVNVDLIKTIPEIEFENLARKCLRILKELYENPSFENEGNFEERMKKYEERSNPILRFVEECCDETSGENIPLREFANACNEYLKQKHLRILTAKQISKVMKDEGFQIGNIPDKLNNTSVCSIKNLKIISNISNISNSSLNPYIETIEKYDINDINDIRKQEDWEDNLFK